MVKRSRTTPIKVEEEEEEGGVVSQADADAGADDATQCGRRRSGRIATGTRNGGMKESPYSDHEENKAKVVKRRKVKEEEEEEEDGEEVEADVKGKTKEVSPASVKKSSVSPSPPSSTTATAAALLQSRKLKTYNKHQNQSPFPNSTQPTPTACHRAHSILSSLHGARTRPPAATLTAPTNTAGCGDSPSVLDALIRTILSQNTSGANSTRAKKSLDGVYGGSDNWAAIVDGGQLKLEAAIRCGGLAKVKSKVILAILEQVRDRYGGREGKETNKENGNGIYSLDHLHTSSTHDAYKELLSFQGVGPKTASCVLLFCLGRESFAVDTHVWRIAGFLGWRPKDAGREATQAHLDLRVPDPLKYPLHVLMIVHGKNCDECRAGGRSAGRCDLRRAFGKNVGRGDGWDGKEEGVELKGPSKTASREGTISA